MLEPKQIKEVADGLAELRGDSKAWKAIRTWVEDRMKDANEMATEPKATPDERTYWGAAERQLRDTLEELEELRAGTFKMASGKTVEQEEEGGE